MISEEQIYSTTISFLNNIFEELFFHIAYQDNNEPDKPFGTIYILNQNDSCSKKTYFDKEQPKEKIETKVLILLQIDIYSDVDNALDYTNRLKAHLRSDKSLYHFGKNGFDIKKLSAIRHLPEISQSNWLYRRGFDITLEATQSDIFDIDYITEVDVSRV